MKYLRTLLPAILILLMVSFTVQAQQIDANRLNRDIKIMENILSEMFRIHPANSGSVSGREVYVYATRSGTNNIRGTYLPEYGVIFQIPKPSSMGMLISRNDDGASGFSFYYGDDDSEENAVTSEGITDRITEFLRDYGSTMGQLGPDDRIMVIYGGAGRTGLFGTYAVSGSRVTSREAPELPVISVAAQMSDLNAYRSGDLSEQQFRSRISVEEAEQNGNGNMDMRVMANIIETAFEGGDAEKFRVTGSVDYLKLDNFGALFYFDARYGSNVFSVRSLAPTAIFSTNDSSSDTARARSQEARARVEVLRGELQATMEENEEKRAENARKTVAAFETFKLELKEYLVDYGRTLGSVESDQFILLSVTLNSSVEGIPDRLDVQVSKTVLEQLDRGDTSRDQALDRVTLREY